MHTLAPACVYSRTFCGLGKASWAPKPLDPVSRALHAGRQPVPDQKS